MKWQTGTRPDPEPCRDKDMGKFEITSRDGQAGWVNYTLNMEL